LFTENSQIDTRPGKLTIGPLTVSDHKDYGIINLEKLIQKSSNVAASKIALALEPEQLWQDFTAFGLGSPTGAYFPGEAMGRMPDLQSWREVGRATMSYGYGLSTSALQLARAYTVLANGGILRPVSFTKLNDNEIPEGRRVFEQATIKSVLKMMTTVTKPGGTARRAAVDNYTVAGKTGTAKKTSKKGGYSEASYFSSFAGIIPAKNPRLAMVVMVDDPQGDKYYGGLIAAPVFSEVMTGAMRLLNITPDDMDKSQMQVANL